MSRHHDYLKNDPRYKAFCEAVKRAAGYRCEECGSEDDLTADHITAIDNGGDPFDIANGKCLCRSCNSRKGNRTGAIRTNYFNANYLDGL